MDRAKRAGRTEDAAVAFLEIPRGFSSDSATLRRRLGEWDIVATRGDILVHRGGEDSSERAIRGRRLASVDARRG